MQSQDTCGFGIVHHGRHACKVGSDGELRVLVVEAIQRGEYAIADEMPVGDGPELWIPQDSIVHLRGALEDEQQEVIKGLSVLSLIS